MVFQETPFLSTEATMILSCQLDCSHVRLTVAITILQLQSFGQCFITTAISCSSKQLQLTPLDYEQLFHNYCNITDHMYKAVGRWAAGRRLYLPIGLLGVSLSPRSASHRPRQAYRMPTTHLTNRGELISDPCIPPIQRSPWASLSQL